MRQHYYFSDTAHAHSNGEGQIYARGYGQLYVYVYAYTRIHTSYIRIDNRFRNFYICNMSVDTGLPEDILKAPLSLDHANIIATKITSWK